MKILKIIILDSYLLLFNHKLNQILSVTNLALI
jgi:hypothetical protein